MPETTAARQLAERAGVASGLAARASGEQRNGVLLAMAGLLEKRAPEIMAKNESDLAKARSRGLPKNLVDRLVFGEKKIAGRASSLRKIAALPDPVGEVFETTVTANGLEASRVRTPLGVILMIYEARPHVTVNAGAFCLKSGNACILRGGSEAAGCNALIGELWREALADEGLSQDAIQVISGPHEQVDELLLQSDCIDLVIPRGGRELIRSVAAKSRIPVIKHFEGVCHVYLDRDADLDRGIAIALDSKCLMPEVCNAMETLLVHEGLLPRLPEILDAFAECGVRIRGCQRTREAYPAAEPATEEDWRAEYLDLIVAVRVVRDPAAAVEHINRCGSHHTDSIVTQSKEAAQTFTSRVDSGVVLVNASTMFCDGESLGMGAEIGISTDKVHARGPMGLRELMSYKFVIRGQGQVMGDPRSFKKRG